MDRLEKTKLAVEESRASHLFLGVPIIEQNFTAALILLDILEDNTLVSKSYLVSCALKNSTNIGNKDFKARTENWLLDFANLVASLITLKSAMEKNKGAETEAFYAGTITQSFTRLHVLMAEADINWQFFDKCLEIFKTELANQKELNNG